MILSKMCSGVCRLSGEVMGGSRASHCGEGKGVSDGGFAKVVLTLANL